MSVSYSINLIDKDNAGRVLSGLGEEVANARRTDTNKHLNEVRARNAVERNRSFAGSGLRQQRLSRSYKYTKP